MELWFAKGILLREGGGEVLREGGLGLGFCGGVVGVGSGVVGRVSVLWWWVIGVVAAFGGRFWV